MTSRLVLALAFLATLAGPAIVEQMDATTVLLPGQVATVDPYLNIIVEG